MVNLGHEDGIGILNLVYGDNHFEHVNKLHEIMNISNIDNHDKPYITFEHFDDDNNNKNQDDMIKIK
jgi:hypothetical protein